MDHIVEFGSDEWVRKQRASEQAAAAAAHNATAGEPSQSSTFVLPIGHSRPPTGKRRASNDATKSRDQKIRSVGHDLSTTRNEGRPIFARPLAGLRSKVPLPALAKSFAGQHNDGLHVEQPLARRKSLWELFDSLPFELQVQIISPLPIRTVLDLRQVSKPFNELISLNEGHIVRYHLNRSIPSYALRLYPPPVDLNFGYFCGMWHRLYVAYRYTFLVAEYLSTKVFLRDTQRKREEFDCQYRRMRRRLMPLVFTLFHFFETYRDLHLKLLKSGARLNLLPFTINPIEKQILDTYDNETLLKVHEIYPVAISSFTIHLRAPSYLTRVELLAKGLSGERPPDEVYLAILMAGGLGQAKRFWQIKELKDRRPAVDTWYSQLTSTPSLKASTTMSKTSRLSPFHRKRSTAEVTTTPQSTAGHKAANCESWFCVNPTCVALSVSRHRHDSHGSSIYNSSLAAGPPMAPIPREDLILLLSDSAPLSNIWVVSAEAEIFKRGIVENKDQIKKNTAVMQALTFENARWDGLYEEWIPPGDFYNALAA